MIRIEVPVRLKQAMPPHHAEGRDGAVRRWTMSLGWPCEEV